MSGSSFFKEVSYGSDDKYKKQNSKIQIPKLKSLRYKIAVPFTLLVIIAVLLPGFIAVYKGFETLTGRAQEAQLLAAQIAAAHLEHLLREKMTTVEGIAKLDSLKQMSPEQIDEYITDIRMHEKGFTSLIIINADGKIVSLLRPGILDDFGLAAAVEWQAEEFQNRTGIKCEVTLEPEDIILDEARSTTIFRIFQEAMTNVARHANATKVKVNLKEKAGELVLEVKDNGKGITEDQISAPKSFGLIGIRERTHSWGGEVKISGIRDKGTTVTASIPLDKKGKEEPDDKNTRR